MPAQNIHVLSEVGTLEELSEQLAKLQKTIKYLINGNLDFENLRARSIKAENIEVGTLTAEEIAANTITAEKMSVDELSAITANLGHITAGLIEAVEIFGSFIATSRTSYPRCEMSDTDHMFVAYASDTKLVKMIASYFSRPGLSFEDNGLALGVLSTPNDFLVQGNYGVSINGGFGPVNLSTSSSEGVRVDNWTELKRATDGRSLQQELNAKQNTISGATRTVYVASSSGGAANTPLTFTNGILTS